MPSKIIAVDFDGTLCENRWPNIGEANIELFQYLIDRKMMGYKIILWTCRTKLQLSDAVNWCYERGLIFDAVNSNIPEIVDAFDGESRKIFANEYIDDRMSDKFKLPFVPEKRKSKYPFFILDNTDSELNDWFNKYEEL